MDTRNEITTNKPTTLGFGVATGCVDGLPTERTTWHDNDPKLLTAAWFSAGVSSAVAVKKYINYIDRIYYTNIDDQHPDSMRFVKDCEQWFGQPVEIMQSELRNVENACTKRAGKGYINGPKGAKCTSKLKRKVRMDWEREHEEYHLRYVWGVDLYEKHRYDRLNISMPAMEHVAPLIDLGITKTTAHQILRASGIKRPAMYDLGYSNNNCVGCVKGGMGYWNKIRIDFPEVFKARAEMERRVGHSCINGVFLDELDPDRGRNSPMIMDDCGIFCELMAV